MSEGICPVEWAGPLAVVTLPEEIDTTNADQVREQLLLVINRGAAVLVADLSATVACDYSGTDALARAYTRAVASGTQLRLVVGSAIVRRALILAGLHRLLPVYPSLEGATAASAGHQQRQEAPALAPIDPAAGRPARVLAATTADDAGPPKELLDSVVNSLFQVGMILQPATNLSPGLTTEHVSEALRRLDDVVRMARDHMFTRHERMAGQGLPPRPQQNLEERLARAAKDAALLREHVVKTAYAMQSVAAHTAALLERRAELVKLPADIDYATEIKRWHVISDRAADIARHWEQGTGTTP